jgi:hypothetical protein
MEYYRKVGELMHGSSCPSRSAASRFLLPQYGPVANATERSLAARARRGLDTLRVWGPEARPHL